MGSEAVRDGGARRLDDCRAFVREFKELARKQF
jgi:hypothetical protein